MALLAGKRALVTGGSKGIGAGIALALAREGADVAINYHRDAAGAAGVAEQIRALGRRALAIGANVGQVAECQRLVAEAAAGLGGLDILINNAGITLWQDFFETDEAHWDATIDTNLKSVFFCTQAAARLMREQRYGRVVNISSGASRSPFLNATPYNASKGGLSMLSVGLAAELGRYNITVNTVGPGAILIERTSHEMEITAATSPRSRRWGASATRRTSPGRSSTSAPPPPSMSPGRSSGSMAAWGSGSAASRSRRATSNDARRGECAAQR